MFHLVSLNAQWKISIIKNNQFVKIKSVQLSTKNEIESAWFDEVLLPKMSEDSIVEEHDFNTVVYRVSKNKKWGLMNTQFKIILKPKYDLLDILISKSNLNVSNVQNTVMAIITKDKIGWTIHQINGSKINNIGVSSIQSIGCEFIEPTLISEAEKACILRDKGNLNIRSTNNVPLLICSQGGEVEKKIYKKTYFQEYEEPDSDGNFYVKRREVQKIENYNQVKNAKWNILNLTSGKMELNEWSDSIFSILVFSYLNDSVDFYPNKLKNSMVHNKQYLLNFSNQNYEGLFDEILEFGENPDCYVNFPVFVEYRLNKGSFFQIKKTFDLKNIQKPFQNFKIFNSSLMNFWVLKNFDTLNLYNFTSDTFYHKAFNDLWEGNLYLPTSEYEDGTLYHKCKLNHQLGVYTFQKDTFLPIKTYEDVNFSLGTYSNAIEIFRNPQRFFFTKLNGKWGMSTLNIIYDNKDSISIPFIYDEIQCFYKYGYTSLKVRQDKTWKFIDFLNHPIDTFPNSKSQLTVKRFYDENHEQMSKFFFLLNPTAEIVESINNTHKSSGWGNSSENKTGIGSYISRGKVLVYDEMMRKMVNEEIYDSIYLLTTENGPYFSSNDPELISELSCFNWSNPTHVKKMKNSSSYFTIPYFMIFKDGASAIIDDENNIVYPFTKEHITVYERKFVEKVILPPIKLQNSDIEEYEEENYKYVFHVNLQIETLKSKIEIPMKVDF